MLPGQLLRTPSEGMIIGQSVAALVVHGSSPWLRQQKRARPWDSCMLCLQFFQCRQDAVPRGTQWDSPLYPSRGAPKTPTGPPPLHNQQPQTPSCQLVCGQIYAQYALSTVCAVPHNSYMLALQEHYVDVGYQGVVGRGGEEAICSGRPCVLV